MIRQWPVALLLTALLVSGCAQSAPPDLQWQRVAPLPTDADLNALVSARSVTLAAGEGGTILTSTDGRTWTLQPTETTADLYGAAAGPAGFVAVGENVVLTSPDGATWTNRPGAAGRHLRAVACGPALCVAVGDGGTVLTGTLTGKWSMAAAGTTADLHGIAFSGGRFVAVGTQGTALASADGRAWTALPLELPDQPYGFRTDLTAITAVGGLWVINGYGFHSFVLTSRNGRDWQLQGVGDVYTPLAATDGSRILRLSFREKEPRRSQISTDLGGTWQTAANNLSWPLMQALAWDGRQFLAAGRDGILMASQDGIAWEPRLPQAALSQGWSDIAFGAGRFVALASGDVASSVDGLTWALQARPAEPLYLSHIVRGPDLFVATGGDGIYTSADGLTWRLRETPKGWPAGRVVWGNGRFVTICGDRTMTSVDGVAWQTGIPLGPDRYFHEIVAGASGYVAWGQNMDGAHNEIFTSDDGLAWTSRGPQPRLESMAYGKGRYVGFTGSGTVITSADGRQWAESKPVAREAVRLFFAGDQFVAMGAESVLTSANGSKWTPAGRQPARHGITGLAYGSGRFVAVGDAGTILASK